MSRNVPAPPIEPPVSEKCTGASSVKPEATLSAAPCPSTVPVSPAGRAIVHVPPVNTSGAVALPMKLPVWAFVLAALRYRPSPVIVPLPASTVPSLRTGTAIVVAPAPSSRTIVPPDST